MRIAKYRHIFFLLVDYLPLHKREFCPFAPVDSNLSTTTVQLDNVELVGNATFVYICHSNTHTEKGGRERVVDKEKI